MAKDQQVKEVFASAKGVHVSPRKARLVAVVLKNLSAQEALEQLRFMTKRAAGPISKLVDSAISNASHNFQIEKERLFIKNFTVDGGPVFKRYSPRAQGRAFPVRKRTSHLNLVLGVRDFVPVKTKKKEIPKQGEKPSEQKLEKQEVIQEKKSRFRFWDRKKKIEDTSQVPPRQDVKGKHYTSFDRRGNM